MSPQGEHNTPSKRKKGSAGKVPRKMRHKGAWGDWDSDDHKDEDRSCEEEEDDEYEQNRSKSHNSSRIIATATSDAAIHLPASTTLGGMVFCVAGTASVGRGKLERLIRKHGGTTEGRVVDDVTHLLLALDGESSVKKNADAARRGLPVITEAEVLGIIVGGVTSTYNMARRTPPTNRLEGMVVCLAGYITPNQTEMSNLVKKHGGTCTARMSGPVTHLICGVDGEATDKHRRAVETGISIVSQGHIFGRVTGAVTLAVPVAQV